jgi:hypothetical protein
MISSEELVLSGTRFCPLDTWDVLREIKERRPGMMLSELIDYRRQALKKSERPELPLPINEATQTTAAVHAYRGLDLNLRSPGRFASSVNRLA